MIIKREYLPELLLNSNFKKLYCFSHGTPPICSIEIAHELKGFVDTYVNENDAITRMSYGSLLDYRELLVIGNGARSMSVSTRDKMKLIDSSRKTLAISKSNPKGFLCGDVYFLYKTSRVLSSRYIHHSGLRLFEDRGKNVVEAAEAVNFSCFIMRGNIFHHHFPNKYLSALKKALEELDRLQ